MTVSMIVPTTVPGQREVKGRPFPLVLGPAEGQKVSAAELTQWIEDNRSHLDGLVKDHGAVLFRDCGIETPEMFADVVEATGVENLPYIGGAAVRHNVVGDRVFTANEAPSSEKIPFHHEMAQVPNFPSFVFFYCFLAPAEGGETPLLPSNRVYLRLKEEHPAFVEKLESLRITYTRVMPSQDDPTSAIGRSWRSTFLTEDRAEAEEKLRAIGSTWEWLPTGDLRTTTAPLWAVRTDERTQQKTFFNSMCAAYTGWKDSRNDPAKAVLFEDGTPICAASIKDALRIMDEECVAIRWQSGDAVYVDNKTVLHARRPFTGPRKIMASLAK